MDFVLTLFLLLSSLYLPAAAEFDGRWPRQIVSSIGLCRYGGRIDCCWGWARRSWGQCQPVCQPQCKHGECVGPNKCKCHPGYAGKTCNQDEHFYPTPLDQGSEQPLFQPLDHQATSLPTRGERALSQVVCCFHRHSFLQLRHFLQMFWRPDPDSAQPLAS